MEETKAAPVRVGVGIDTARYGHHVAFLGEDRQDAAKDFTFAESNKGYSELETALRKISQRYGGAVHFDVRLDAAGQYAINLEAFLRRLDVSMTLSVGEPKRNRDYKNVHYPKRKADAVDSRACARFAVVERPRASAQAPTGMGELREILGALNAQTKQTTRHLNQLHGLLARVFPELDTMIADLSAQWVLDLLAKYPSPKRIIAARSLGAIRHLSVEQAQQIQAVARTSVASLKGGVAEALVKQGVEKVQSSQRMERQLEKLLAQAYKGLGAGGHQHLITIAGIGYKTAAALTAKIFSIERFETPAQLVNYFGAFPEENTSGVNKDGTPKPRGSMQMSNKGNDMVRGLLWMACQSGLRCNPALRALYARQRAAGKRGDVALGHCMRKMLHLVFAVWKTDTAFDPTHYQWEASPGAEPTNNPPEPVTDNDATLQLTEDTMPSTPATNELATRCASDCCPARERDDEEQKKTAGRKQAMPARKAVTAATNELATRKLSVANEPNKTVAHNDHTQQQAGSAWVDFAYLRKQITVERILANLGVFDRMQGRGPQRRGPCPIHGSEGGGGRPFSVNLQKNLFRCLNPACAAQGNVLDLWAAIRHLPLHQAALDLAKQFHLQIAPQYSTR